MIDVHNHLQDERLAPFRDDCIAELRRLGVTRWVVNGTRESDWESVADLAEGYPDEVIPCFGLHPWFVKERSKGWQDRLAAMLERFPQAGLGEVGLDKWIRDHRIEEQTEVLRSQLSIAAEHKRPVMIHCLQAWGRLLEVLRDETSSDVRFLVHSFGGPVEMVEPFVEIGAYFSFSGYFIQERKEKVRQAFEEVPRERLLIETDSPDMNLPESRDRYGLKTSDDERINHPGNLEAIYDFVSEWLGIDRETLNAQIKENFAGLLGQ